MNFSELREFAKLHPKEIGCFTRSKLSGLSTEGNKWVLYEHGMTLGVSIGNGSIYALRNGFDNRGRLVAVPNLNRRLA